MPPLALSTCWQADRTNDGASLLRQATELGFSHVELSHNTRFSLWPGILAEHRFPHSPKIDVLHNFCPFRSSSSDPTPTPTNFPIPAPPAVA